MWEKHQAEIISVVTKLQSPLSFWPPIQPQPKSTDLVSTTHEGPSWKQEGKAPHGAKEAWQARRAQVMGVATAHLWSGDSAAKCFSPVSRDRGMDRRCMKVPEVELARCLKAPGSWPIAPRSCQLHLVSWGPLLAEFSTHQENHCQKSWLENSLTVWSSPKLVPGPFYLWDIYKIQSWKMKGYL